MHQLCYEVDVEPYAKSRDAAVASMAAEAGVAVCPCVSHTLYVSDQLFCSPGANATHVPCWSKRVA